MPGMPKQTKATFPAGVGHVVQYGNKLKSQLSYLHEYQLLPLGRVQETMHDFYGQEIAEGTILSACAELAGQVAPV